MTYTWQTNRTLSGADASPDFLDALGNVVDPDEWSHVSGSQRPTRAVDPGSHKACRQPLGSAFALGPTYDDVLGPIAVSHHD